MKKDIKCSKLSMPLYLTVLLVMLLSGTACSPTSETVTTAAQFETDTVLAESSSTSVVEPSSLLPNTGQGPTDQEPPDQELTETKRYVYEYPDFFLTNGNDLSTPVGTICWTLWEFTRMGFLEWTDLLAENSPILEVVYPDVSGITDGEDHLIDPVGVVKEETEESDGEANGYTYLDALVEIQKLGIAGIVNDSGLSEELQLFAQAFFEMVAAIESQTRTVGYENIDYGKLPYQDLEDLPNIRKFEMVAAEHPEECIFPSVRDVEEWDDYWDAQNEVTD